MGWIIYICFALLFAPQVKTSRWAFTEVPNVEVNNPGNLEADVYSKLRSPWNVNNRP